MNRFHFCLAALFLATWAAAQPEDSDSLPKPELTEYWTPVPTVVASPAGGVPSDAIVLLDGRSTEAWLPAKADQPMWPLVDGALVITPKTAGILTKQSFGDIQLHLEFRTPGEITGDSQKRGNSGVLFMGRYELQVLDSWNNPTYVNGQAGSIYKQHPPLVNASRPPAEWQTYDVVFIAPRFALDGSVLKPARMTVFYNGVLVQHDAVLTGATTYRGQPKYVTHPPKQPLHLQEHNDQVAYRNIWVRELTLP